MNYMGELNDAVIFISTLLLLLVGIIFSLDNVPTIAALVFLWVIAIVEIFRRI